MFQNKLVHKNKKFKRKIDTIWVDATYKIIYPFESQSTAFRRAMKYNAK